MAKKIDILSVAKKALAMEAAAINGLESYVDSSFVQLVEAIHGNKGRLVISGIGKSAIIAQKIVATFNSTGSAAIYLHAADAIHGDSGIIHPEDMVMIISKSGESPEIKNLVQLIKQFGNPIIGMVGNTSSYLAQHSNHIINTTITQEACINNLAPTSSTTAQMVMGDLLAISLMELNQFDATHFAKFHPGGNLGKRLTLTAGSIAQVNAKPCVQKSTSIKEVIIDISKGRLGATVVTNEQENVLGIITDGDIRRMLNDRDSIAGLTAQDIMTKNPKMITTESMVIDAFNIMEDFSITQLVVVDEGEFKGILHLHDILKEGIV